MSKRYGNAINNQPSKKPRVEASANNKPIGDSAKATINTEDDDLWGEDFGEEEVEKLDLIASQACSQEANVSTVNINDPGPSRMRYRDKPLQSINSMSSSSSISSFNAPKTYSNLTKPQGPRVSKYHRFNAGLSSQISQKLASSENLGKIADDIPTLTDFKNNLVGRKNLNSTFQFSQNNGNVVADTDEEKSAKLEKIENDYKRLLNDITAKEGETMFLRQQLQQTQMKAEKENMAKTRQIEELASQNRKDMNALHKQVESLKTQIELKDLELNNTKERYKMQESKSIKLTTPQTLHVVDSPKNRLITPLSRATSVAKVKVADSSIQTDNNNGEIYYLRASIVIYPFKKIPQTIFQSSLPEKSIIDIEIVEKTGKRIIPIIEDEESFKKFKNKDYVKPKVTLIDDRILSVEFFQPDVSLIIKKSETEVQSIEVMFTINKIIATSRELMLNLVGVFQTITNAINNDDIRDMNDLYFSNFYDMQLSHTLSLCDANEWHEKERGIEARRTLGILSYIAENSDYLCGYIAGKSELNIQGDVAYNQYSKQMIQYNSWPKKGEKHEFLKIILELVTSFNFVRRAHQFTGLICSIARLLGIVQKQVKFPNKGLNYVVKIFHQLVFSRPLFRCLISMTKMIVEFNQCPIFINRITACPNRTAIGTWKNVLSFTDDACVLKVYIEQLKRFHFDEITMINITHALMSFVDVGFRSQVIPWRSETDSDDCCGILLTFAITMLYQCAKINLATVRNRFSPADKTEKNKQENLYDHFWHRVKHKHLETLRMGIRFLSYLAKRDPEFINRSIVVDNSLTLFMEYINSVDGLTLYEVEREALTLIKSFTSDMPSLPDRTSEVPQLSSTNSELIKKSVPRSTSGKSFTFRSIRGEDQKMSEMFSSMLQL